MKLFEPCNLGRVSLRNRLIMSPMCNNLSQDGFVTERMIRFYEERAKGGVGLVVVEDGIVDAPIGNNVKEAVSIDDDKQLPMLRELTRRIKAHGARAAIQLNHAGRRAGKVSPKTGYLEISRGKIPVAPSKLPHPDTGYVVPRELSTEEIYEVVLKFGRAARRAVEAGFDIVGLHCAHTYLCGEFLSPWSNKRIDEYGGDLEGRFRFVREVLAAIRREIGDDVPLFCRVNGSEPSDGNTPREIQQIARMMEAAGVNAISVSTGMGVTVKDPEYRALLPAITPMRTPEGCLVDLAQNIKQAVSIPIIVANMIRSIDFAESLLQQGKADFIAMARPLVADPELANKAMSGEIGDIVPCFSCCQCYQNVIEKDLPIVCTVNPMAGREGEVEIRPAERPKRVLVVGGGPAGMAAAITARARGHMVEVLEKENALGGQMVIGSRPPGKSQVRKVIDYYSYQAERSGVRVVTGKAVGAEEIRRLAPEAVIVAVGSRPVLPRIPGLEQVHVVTARDVLAGTAEIGQKVAIVGGGQVGAETAEYLAEQGRHVTIIEMLPTIAADMPGVERPPLLFSLEDYGVRMLTQTTVKHVRPGEVVFERKGKEGTVSADTIVIAAGAVADTAVVEAIKSVVPDAIVIGDSDKPGKIIDAIRAGFEAGLRI